MTFRINNQRFQDFLQKVNDYSKQPDRLTQIQFLVIRIALDIFTICIFEAVLKYNITHPKKNSETQKTTEDKANVVATETLNRKPAEPKPLETEPETKSGSEKKPEAKPVVELKKDEVPAIVPAEQPKTEEQTDETKSILVNEVQTAPQSNVDQPSENLAKNQQTLSVKSIEDLPLLKSFQSNSFTVDVLEKLSELTDEKNSFLLLDKLKDTNFYKREQLVYSRDVTSALYRYRDVPPYVDTLMTFEQNLNISGNIIEMPHAPLLYAYQAPKLGFFSKYFEYLKTKLIKHVVVLGPDLSGTKYDPYFPLDDKPFDYEEFGLKCDSVTEVKGKDFMQYNLQYKSSSEKLAIITYTDWPDHGVVTAQDLLDLVEHVATVSELQSIGVHCSAGIGRTGVFLSVYYAYLLHLQGIQCELNYAQIVACLRLFRAKLVLTLEQLKLVKDTIALFPQKTVS